MQKYRIVGETKYSDSAGLTIGSLARAADVNVETIRYYQRIGIIDEPEKPDQGYRRYPAGTTERIRFIKRAQELGFTLLEISDLLSLNDGDCREARSLAEHKQEIIQQRIDDLKAMQAALDTLISRCKKNVDGHELCAIIEALTKVGSNSFDQ